MDQFFSNIQSIISQDLELISASSFKRQSKTTPQNMLYFLINLIKSHRESSVSSAITISNNGGPDINASTYRKRRNTISSSFFKMIPNSLRNYFYTKSLRYCRVADALQKNRQHLSKLLFNKYRVIGCDGWCFASITYALRASWYSRPIISATPQKLDKEGYKLTKNQTYVDATINGLYDVLNNMVIDLHLTPYSEQKAYYEQIPNLQKGDIVIHDRNAAVPIFHTSY